MVCGNCHDFLIGEWEPPKYGWIKVNCDEAFDSNTKEAGAGVIARNSEGVVVGGSSSIFNAACAV